jgi:hypothetical protein
VFVPESNWNGSEVWASVVGLLLALALIMIVMRAGRGANVGVEKKEIAVGPYCGLEVRRRERTEGREGQ